jgi:DNA-directed RNA polymerase specialized sigma24 family protein
LLKITNNLDSFRGESHFTTWAKNIAMNVALTERRRWRDVSLQELLAGHQGTGRGLADLQLTPEQVAFQNIVLAEVRGIIDKELTDRQREVVVAVILDEAAHGSCGTPSTGGAGSLRRRVRPRASSESRTSEVEQEICNVGSR